MLILKILYFFLQNESLTHSIVVHNDKTPLLFNFAINQENRIISRVTTVNCSKWNLCEDVADTRFRIFPISDPLFGELFQTHVDKI